MSTFSLAEDHRTFIAKGDEYYSRFENLNALKQYEEAYKIAKNDYEVLLKLTRTCNDVGEEFKELRKPEEAEKYINKAVEYAELFKSKFSDSAAVYTYLALSYGNVAMFRGGKEKVKFAQKIKENLDISMKKNPHDFLPYIILGIYNREVASLSWIEKLFANTFFGELPEGSYEESEKLFLKALNLEPGMIVATFQLARTYRRMEREKDEINMLKKVISLPTRDFRDKYAINKSKKRLTDLEQL
jgi:tetratricopeptide (TPR) repeat protein